MAQIQKKFIADDAVDGSKIRLDNAQELRARNAADSADVNILEVDASDRIVFASVPQSPSDALVGNDLVRYSQLATLVEGIKPKQAVVVASTGNIDLSVAADPSPIDGHTIADDDRVLLRAQTDSAENGIYVAVDAVDPTTWVRSADFNSASEIPGAFTAVEFGTLYQGYVFVTTSVPTVIGTDPIIFVARPDPSAYTGGDMITISSNVVSVDLASVSGLESTNPGNAAGQLRVKLEVSNPSLQIDGSNQLGAKLDAAGAIVKGAAGLAVNVDGVTIDIATNAIEVKTGGISNAQINAAAAIAYSKLDLADSVKASDMDSEAATAGQVLTADGAGGASYESPAAAPVTTEDILTLNGTDITNQYKDLAHPAQGASASVNSISLNVAGGPEQLKVVDYTVSLTGGVAGVTRITFAGDLATGGPSALISGDILMVKYAY